MQFDHYVIFGAGQIGSSIVRNIGEESILYFIDNDSNKAGKEIHGIKIYHFEDVCGQLDRHFIVVAVGKDKKDGIIAQLERNNIKSYIYYEELLRQIIKKKIENRQNYIEIYDKAIRWIQKNAIHDKGISVASEIRKSYPEVTGYYIPSLLCWGYRDLALSFAKWLCSIQKEDGSWYDTENSKPYIFDSAQILKGLIAIRELYPQADEHILKGCNWILSNMQEDGRLPSPRENDFGDGKTCAEVIHIYCLSPIVAAADLYEIPEYREKAYKILNYYKENAYEEIMNFGLLSHFYAYVMEGLVDMGEDEMARKAMEGMEAFQRENGAVPGYCNVNWVCSVGVFQLALVWYRLGNIEKGNRAFEYACKLQNASGGWFGSYMSEENRNEDHAYFPHSEISWSAKYFLDALYWKNRAGFEKQASIFKDAISLEDEKYQTIEKAVRKIMKEKNLSPCVLDAGCGKGAYLKNLLKRVPQGQYAVVDISESVMQSVQCPEVMMKQGVLTNIPYKDDAFDLVYSCEALEHAVDIDSSIKEMARVTKAGGMIVIIDKNKSMLGYFEIEDCEQWFDKKELSNIMLQYCSEVEVKTEVGYEESVDGLFYTWTGKVR